MKKRPPTGNFDLLAPLYDFLAFLVYGRSIKGVQKALIKKISPGKKVLLVGGGTGWLIRELYEQVPPSDLFYVDASAKMIQMSRKVLKKLDPSFQQKVNLIQDQFENLVLPTDFDVVICFFFFDLFEKEAFAAVFDQLDNCLKKGGSFLVADFFIGKGKNWQRLLVRAMYAFFRVFSQLKNRSLPPVQMAFEEKTYRLIFQKSYFKGFIKGFHWEKTG